MKELIKTASRFYMTRHSCNLISYSKDITIRTAVKVQYFGIWTQFCINLSELINQFSECLHFSIGGKHEYFEIRKTVYQRIENLLEGYAIFTDHRQLINFLAKVMGGSI